MSAGSLSPTSAVMLDAARSIAIQTKADALFVYSQSEDADVNLKPGPGKSYKTILVTQKNKSKARVRGQDRYIVRLPDVPLTRMGLVKMATVIGFSGLVQLGVTDELR